MSQVIEANCPILTNPPWKGGKAKYRLGLKPINLDEWFDATINPDIYKYKTDNIKINHSLDREKIYKKLKLSSIHRRYVKNNNKMTDLNIEEI